MTDTERLERRITELELTLMHTQRLLEQLDEALRDQQTRLVAIESRVRTVTAQVDRVSASLEEQRDAADERPPHY